MSTRSQVLKKLKRRQVRAKKLAEQSVVLGKVVGKELLVLGKGAALAVEPRFLRRARRRHSHLRRIKEHEARALKINAERLQIESDRANLAAIKREQGQEKGDSTSLQRGYSRSDS